MMLVAHAIPRGRVAQNSWRQSFPHGMPPQNQTDMRMEWRTAGAPRIVDEAFGEGTDVWDMLFVIYKVF